MKPDWEHYRRVARAFTDPMARIAAYYHDAIEDGWMDEAEVRDIFREPIAEVIVTLTRRDESYADYIMRIADKGSLLAIEVKVADLRDNLARADGEYASLRPRYEKALRSLEPLVLA